MTDVKFYCLCNILTLDRAINQEMHLCNSETGASGQRYRNITLTCGCGWIRCRCVCPQEAGRHQTGATDGLREFKFQAVGDRMPAEWEPALDRGLGPSVTHGWAAQPECERSAAMVRRTLGQYVAVCPCLQLTSHTQETPTLSRIKCERYIFIKKRVCFVHWSSSLFVSAYIFIYVYVLCSCIMAIQHLWFIVILGMI